MAWIDNHSICDLPMAYRAARSVYFGDTNLAMGDSSVASVAAAEAAALLAATNGYIGDLYQGVNIARGFRVASNVGGTFASTMAALVASLPPNVGLNKAMMISGA